MPVDDILFSDTGLEFPQMYEHLEKLERYTGRTIIRLTGKVVYRAAEAPGYGRLYAGTAAGIHRRSLCRHRRR